MHDFESEFYGILAASYHGENVPAFPAWSHATPREWMMHERVTDDTPVKSVAPPTVPDDAWVAPSGRRYAVGETVDDADLSGGIFFNEEAGKWEDTGTFLRNNHEHATWDHPGNPNPFYRRYPQPDDNVEFGWHYPQPDDDPEDNDS